MTHAFLPVSTPFCMIRTAQPADIMLIIQMVAKLAAYHGDRSTLTPEFLSQLVIGPDPWIHILVAEKETKLIGFVTLCRFVRLPFNARGLDMNSLFVENDFRRLGVGKALVDACITIASVLKCRYLTVGTQPDNLDAQAFYTALEFVRREVFPPRFFLEFDE